MGSSASAVIGERRQSGRGGMAPRLFDTTALIAMAVVAVSIGAWLQTGAGLARIHATIIATLLAISFLSIHLLLRRLLALQRAQSVEANGEGQSLAGFAIEPLPAEEIEQPASLANAPVRQSTAEADERARLDAPLRASDDMPAVRTRPPDIAHDKIIPDEDVLIAPWPPTIEPEPEPNFERAWAERVAQGLPDRLPLPESDREHFSPVATFDAQTVPPPIAPASPRPPKATTVDEVVARHGSLPSLDVLRPVLQPSFEPASVIEDVAGQARVEVDSAKRHRASTVPSKERSEQEASGAAADAEDPSASVERWQGNSEFPASGAASALIEAHRSGGLQLLLQPIADLAHRKAVHMELKGSLTIAENLALDGDELRKLAAGCGLLPSLDSDKIAAARGVAQRLEQRRSADSPGPPSEVHTAIHGESLVDESFLEDFADANYLDGPILAEHLILTFPQSEVRHFSTAQWSTLHTMTQHGFRFSLDQVTDLDMDYGQLTAHGFRMIKLDAAVFLEGLPVSGEVTVPAIDICNHLERQGFSLIVDAIDDEELLDVVTGLGVKYGQGSVLGSAKPLKPGLWRARRMGTATAATATAAAA